MEPDEKHSGRRQQKATTRKRGWWFLIFMGRESIIEVPVIPP
jgi:hypothetical protein